MCLCGLHDKNNLCSFSVLYSYAYLHGTMSVVRELIQFDDVVNEIETVLLFKLTIASIQVL